MYKQIHQQCQDNIARLCKRFMEIRCETTYDSKKEGIRLQLQQKRHSAKLYIKMLKMNGALTIDQVLQMSSRDKMKLAEKVNRSNAWTQQTLREMNFRPMPRDSNMKGRKRTQRDIQRTAATTRISTQLIIVNGKLERQRTVQPARKVTGKKKKKQTPHK